MENKWQVVVWMPDDLVIALDNEAIRRDISRASLIREACIEKVQRAMAEAAEAKARKKAAQKATQKKKAAQKG